MNAPDLERELHSFALTAPGPELAPTLRRRAARLAPLMPAPELDAVVARVLARTGGLGPLDALLADPDVTDVLLNAGREVWVERRGRLEQVITGLPDGSAELLIERVVAPLGLRADRAHPVVDARLPDGTRVHAVVPPVAVDGPCMALRRFSALPLPLEAMCTPAVAGLLRAAVQERRNILVIGGTGSGKTTLLNALAGCIDPHERVVTVEDAAELRLPLPHVVRLEARPGSVDGARPVTQRELVRAALRMRPDRIVVGECRGGEAIDVLQAMNTGHEGSLSTCHANSPIDALRRLATMVLFAEAGLPHAAVVEQVHAAVDLVVQVVRRPDGTRAVVDVAEVRPADAPPVGVAPVRSLLNADGSVGSMARPSRMAVVS
jgi:pilus assembly protein CpaF